MAQLILPVAGAAFGGFAGGGLQGVALGWSLGRLGSQLLGIGVVDQTREGPRLTEFRISDSAYGRSLGSIDGSLRREGFLMWFGAVQEHRHEEDIGGKGLGPSIEAVTFTYTATLAIGFAINPELPTGLELLQLFEGTDQRKIVDFEADPTTGAFHATFAENFGSATSRLRYYPGTMTQEPDPAIQAKQGADNTPAYIGVSYMVLEDWPVETSLPPFSAKLSSNAADAFPIETLSNATGTVLTNAALSPDGRLLYDMWGPGTGERIVMWDLSTRTELQNVFPADQAGAALFPVSVPQIDPYGNVYLRKRDSGARDPGSIHKFDANLNLLASSPFAGTGAEPIMFRVLFPPSATVGVNLPGRIIYFTTAGHTGVIATEPGGEIQTQTGKPELPLWFESNLIDHFDPTSGSFLTIVGSNPRGMTVDGVGDPWIIISDSVGESHLFRLDIGTAIPLEKHIPVPGSILQDLFYDSATDSLLFRDTANNDLHRFRLSSRSVDATLAGVVIGGDNQSQVQQGTIDGKIWFRQAQTLVEEIDVVTMTVSRSEPLAQWGFNNTTGGMLYHEGLHAVILANESVSPSQGTIFYLDRKADGITTEQEVFERYSKRVGLLVPGKVDAAELVDQVHGFGGNQVGPARSFLEILQPAFNHDVIEEQRADGYKIRAPKRGKAAVATIDIGELGARPFGTPRRPPLQPTSVDEEKLPQFVELAYLNKNADYLPDQQSDNRNRNAVATREAHRADWSFLASRPGEMRKAARRLLWEAWARAVGFSFSLSRKYTRLSPADNIHVVDGAVTYRVFLEQVTQAGGVIPCRGFVDDIEHATLEAAGVDPLGIPDNDVETFFPPELFVLDINLLEDAQDGLVRYVAAGGFGGGLQTSVLERSSDGQNWQVYHVFGSADEVTHGFLAEALPVKPSSPGHRDRLSTLKVQLYNGSLTTATIDQVDDDPRVNAFVTADGEIGQFVAAADQGDGLWHLTVLSRERRGTVYAGGPHPRGTKILFPSASTVFPKPFDAAELGVTYQYRLRNVNAPPASATLVALETVGNSMKSYRPSNLKATLDGANDWTLTFELASRMGGTPLDWSDVPLFEPSLDFEIDIMSGADPLTATVVQTLKTTALAGGSVITVSASSPIGEQSGKYESADQVTDFGSNQTTLYWRPVQLGLYGRGHVHPIITST
jgi:hypothetical protein